MGSEDPDNLSTKLKQTAKMDSSTLPHDQLAKMFPTPPSLEHPSPADGTMEVDHGLVKMEPFSPAPDLTDWWTGGEDFDAPFLSSSKFAPLKRLYSDGLPALITPTEFKYKPQRQPRQPPNTSGTTASNANVNNQGGSGNGANQRVILGSSSSGSRSGSAQTPLGTPNMKQSPISPSVEGGPRSMQHHSGAGSGHDIASPSTTKDSILNKESSR